MMQIVRLGPFVAARLPELVFRDGFTKIIFLDFLDLLVIDSWFRLTKTQHC